MAFCEECGCELLEDAKFCSRCGTPVRNKVNENFDGSIYKCPNCGHLWRAFESVCPHCKYELRNSKVANAIKEFEEKFENAKSENQKISIVKNFPIPNTKEDILEFMVLASSNFDSSYYIKHLEVDDISDAWLAKIEQCYQKARLSFKDDELFAKIELEYSKIKKDCFEKGRKIEKEKEYQRATKERIEKAKLFKKSKLRILIIVFIIISILWALISFTNGKIITGIIAIVSIALFMLAFLFGNGTIKEKIKNMRMIPLIVAFVLFISCYYIGINEDRTPAKWEDIILKEYVPKPIMTSAYIMTNSREEFYVYDIKCTQREFYNYVDNCKEFGYNYEILEEDESSFEAYNSEGYKIKLTYIITLSIDLTAPMEMNLIEWPNSDIAKLIPQAQSEYGKISWENDYGFVIYIGNTTLAEYKEYVKSVYNSGFNIDYSKGDTYFWADNIDGYQVTIRYEGYNTMFIRMDEPNDN